MRQRGSGLRKGGDMKKREGRRGVKKREWAKKKGELVMRKGRRDGGKGEGQ